ncbi:hypothetical protein [Terrisporobacter mayombei]|uniref:Phage gp6-like head-tail connector protein n=1 Tax=Terrisporobacter mayombei TaxID=1541 RepID=A0ABY9PW43_9FIRM|nr:hypothetical protein [Terrisporobacter mayombei]WMT79908.1 hypothetical protein TEMA_01790 [Terrisporobacter mayombei]
MEMSTEEKKAIAVIRNYLNVDWEDSYILSEYDFVVDQLIQNSKASKSADIKSMSEGDQSVTYKDNSGPWTITDDIKAMLPKPYIKLFY